MVRGEEDWEGIFAGQYPGTNQVFIAFLTECLKFEDHHARRFANGIRNGIIHQAETRGWLVWHSEPVGTVVAKEGELFVLNRTLFCRELRNWFDCYLSRLRDAEERELRKKFICGMDHIVRKCRKVN